MKKNSKGVRRVLIVDDHPMMRNGLTQLIDTEPDLKAAWQADNAGQAMEIIASQRPDLVLVDISLPDRSGVELIKDIHSLHPGMPILVFSMHDETLYAERVLRAGARGYIMKQEGGNTLLQAMRQVLAGHIYLSSEMSAKALEVFSGHRPDVQSPVERLSDREFEVFQLIGQGFGTREIAHRLHLSVKTVEVHRANIRKRLELKTGHDLIRYAIRWTEVQKP